MLRALALLTSIPVPSGRDADTPGGVRPLSGPSTLMWFPLVGALVGGIAGAVWWGAGERTSLLLAAALALVADLVLTGALHLDGLADSGDGLIPPMQRTRRLEVMADPAVGAFGLAAVLSVMALRWAALGSQVPDVAAVAGLWAWSRTVMALSLSTLPSARPGGMAAAFSGGSPFPVAVVGGAVSGGLLMLSSAEAGLAAMVTGLIAAMAVTQLARTRLGGITGDVLGAICLVVETVGLVTLALLR